MLTKNYSRLVSALHLTYYQEFTQHFVDAKHKLVSQETLAKAKLADTEKRLAAAVDQQITLEFLSKNIAAEAKVYTSSAPEVVLHEVLKTLSHQKPARGPQKPAGPAKEHCRCAVY